MKVGADRERVVKVQKGWYLRWVEGIVLVLE
jgi:hypothetical protein